MNAHRSYKLQISIKLGSTRFAGTFLAPSGQRKRITSSVRHIVNDIFSGNGAIFEAGGITLLTDGQTDVKVEIVI